METTTTKTENKMVKMFNELKSKHPDAVILFRVGDFYETYCEDAMKIAEVLGLTLTRQAKTKMDLTGFPYHALDTYLPKLIRAGLRVAICDDISEPVKLKHRGSDETTEPQVEEAQAEEVNTEEPQQEQEESKPDKWAHVYYPNGDFQETQPNNGSTFELEELQEVVGGYIEIVRLNDGRIIIVNEDGLSLNLPVNIEATNILRRDHSTTEYIVGTAIVCDADMLE